MSVHASDAIIASEISSFTQFYWGPICFMFADFERDSLESLRPVEISKTANILKFDVWKSEGKTLKLTLQNTSETTIPIFIQQEFSDDRCYELEETVHLIPREIKHFREFREESKLQIKILSYATTGDRVCRNSDVLFFAVRTRYFIV